MLSSLQIGFSFVRVVVACAALERISSRYLKLVTVPSFCLFTLITIWMPLALFVIRLVFSALTSILHFVQVLSRLSTGASSSCSSSARASMSSTYRRLVTFRPTYLDHSKARAYCTCSRCRLGCLDIFSSPKDGSV